MEEIASNPTEKTQKILHSTGLKISAALVYNLVDKPVISVNSPIYIKKSTLINSGCSFCLITTFGVTNTFFLGGLKKGLLGAISILEGYLILCPSSKSKIEGACDWVSEF